MAFLDSDDRWFPGKLQKQLAILEQDGSIGGVYCGLCSVDLESGEIVPQGTRSYPSGDLLAEMLIHDVSNPTSCWMVRRSCFEKAGIFDASLPARQDWDMWIRISAEYQIGVVPEVLVEMGEHTGERVRTDPSREISAHKTIFRKYSLFAFTLSFLGELGSTFSDVSKTGQGVLTPQAFKNECNGHAIAGYCGLAFQF